MLASEFQTRVVDGRERLVTPTDETGLPFCFAPTVSLPRPHVPPADPTHPTADLNHQFPKFEVHTSTHPILTDGLARTALAQSRVQWVDYDQHHGTYNHNFIGPDYPDTHVGLFRVLTMADVGYIPRQALDLSGPDPKIVNLTKKQRRWLWTSGQVRTSCRSPLLSYLRRYVLEQDMDHIPGIEIEEFVYTDDRDKRVKLARTLADRVSERAAEPLEPTYQDARTTGVLTYVHVAGRKTAAPNNSRDLLRDKLWAGDAFGRMQAALHARLAQEPRRPFGEYFSDRLPSGSAG
jgi:hypothetical protein